MTSRLFVFSNTVAAEGSLKLNILQDQYEVTFNTQVVRIKLTELNEHSSSMVMYNNALDQLYCLHNFRQIAEEFKLSVSEVLTKTQNNAFMQIDCKQGSPFVKIFLPQGQYTLLSDTHDFADNCYLVKDFIHPLDWQYCATYDLVHIDRRDGLLTAIIEVAPALSGEQVFLNYGKQVWPLGVGENHVSLTYCQGEKFYIGRPGCRYEGQTLEVEKLLCTIN